MLSFGHCSMGTDESKTHIFFKPIFQIYFRLKKFTLMQNYGAFT